MTLFDQTKPAPAKRHRSFDPVLQEVRALVALALPIAATQIAQMAVSTTDILMIGRLGTPELGAAVIAGTYQFMGWLLGLGPMSAVAPIIAQRLGADPGDTRDVRRALRMSFWAVGGVALPLVALNLAAPVMLKWFGQSDEIIRLAVPYIWTVTPGLVFAMGFLAMRNCLSALSYAKAPLAVAAFLVALNALLGYALIFGHFGLPHLALIGAGIASTISNAASFLLLLGWMLWWPSFKRYRFLHNWWRADWAKLKEMFRLGLPIGITTLFEASLFQAGVFMMGHIGTVDLAAHQIAINISSITFMVPLGLSQAATVRVGLAAGARKPQGVRHAAYTAIVFGGGFMAVCAILILVFARQFAGLYLGAADAARPAVIERAASFLAIAAAYQVFDSSQVVAAGALRGLKDTRIPAFLACISYWLVGMPAAVGLGFFTPLSGRGIWIAYALGLGTAACLLLARVVVLTRPGALGARAAPKSS